MTLDEAIFVCHVRSAVYRRSNPRKRYWKNHTIPIKARVPERDHSATDWEEFDPREDAFEAMA